MPACLFAETLSNKDLKKKMSPTNAKALNTMRQRIKKHNSSEEMGQLVQKYRWVGGDSRKTAAAEGLIVTLPLSSAAELIATQTPTAAAAMGYGIRLKIRQSLLTGSGVCTGQTVAVVWCGLVWRVCSGRILQPLLMMMTSRRRSPAAAAVRVRQRRERRGRSSTSAQVRPAAAARMGGSKRHVCAICQQGSAAAQQTCNSSSVACSRVVHTAAAAMQCVGQCRGRHCHAAAPHHQAQQLSWLSAVGQSRLFSLDGVCYDTNKPTEISHHHTVRP
jgi:hypothetical protein